MPPIISQTKSYFLAFIDYHSLLAHRGQFLDDVVALPEGGEPDLLRELCEGGVGEEGDVTDQLVDHVGLRSVHRLGGVPVLKMSYYLCNLMSTFHNIHPEGNAKVGVKAAYPGQERKKMFQIPQPEGRIS